MSSNCDHFRNHLQILDIPSTMTVLRNFDMKVKTDYKLGYKDDSMHVKLTVPRNMNGTHALDHGDFESSVSNDVYTFEHNMFHEDSAGKTVKLYFELELYHKDSDVSCIIGTISRDIAVAAK